MDAQDLSPDVAEKILDADFQNIVKKVAAGKPLTVPTAHADDDLAQQLTNPLADLISMPVQGNMAFGVGPGDGHRFFTNVQPVIPFNLNEDWNLISRTILPVIDQNGIDFAGNRSDAFGLGDTVQSLWFSPAKSEPFIRGVGPVFLLPTATDSVLGADKWGAGPTGGTRVGIPSRLHAAVPKGIGSGKVRVLPRGASLFVKARERTGRPR